MGDYGELKELDCKLETPVSPRGKYELQQMRKDILCC
jgi:hypothetical protein